FSVLLPPRPTPPPFPYTTLFRSTTNVTGAVLQQDASGTAIWDNDLNINSLTANDITTDSLLVNEYAQFDGPTVFNDSVSFSGERSEEHTSELQSRENLVCRLLLE